jgi:PKD repeat protein
MINLENGSRFTCQKLRSLVIKCQAFLSTSKNENRNFLYRGVNIFFFCLLSASLAAQVPMVRLNMAGTSSNALDETVIYYQSGATVGFDSNYDAYKLQGPNPAPMIAQEYGGNLMQINGVEPVTQSFSILLLAKTNSTDDFTISASDFNFLPKGTCVTLTDLFTGSLVNILSGDYNFTLEDSTTVPRFILDINFSTLPVTTQEAQPDCGHSNGGKFIIQGTTQNACSYSWKKNSGVVIKSSGARIGGDTLQGLASGTYLVEVIDYIGCKAVTNNFTIDPVVIPQADFNCATLLYNNLGDVLLTTNTSQNASEYSWDFGDSSANEISVSAAHTFAATGQFKVQLVATSSTFCTDTAYKIVTVSELTTGTNNVEPINDLSWSSLGDNKFLLRTEKEETLNIQLYDERGRLLTDEQRNGKIMEFDFGTLSSGFYILNCSGKNSRSISFTIQ